MNNSVFVFRNDFSSRYAYLKAYREHNANYGFKSRVEGGWIFFEFATDYRTWKNQR